MGCAECKLLRLLIREESVKELVGVDLQIGLLEAQKHCLKPLTTDFVFPRKHPLTVRLMQGIYIMLPKVLIELVHMLLVYRTQCCIL